MLKWFVMIVASMAYLMMPATVDLLRCKTPKMVRKEILMHLIAYNCIRRLMLEAAEAKGVTLHRITLGAAIGIKVTGGLKSLRY